MKKIVQLVMNEQVLVALCDDGSVSRLSFDGTEWYELPSINKSRPLPTTEERLELRLVVGDK